MPDPLADLAVEAVSHSPVLQNRVAGFVDRVLDAAEDVLDNGTPKMQADIINKLVPHLVNQLADKAEDEEVKTMRAELNILRSQMRDSLEPRATPTPTPEPSEVEAARIQRVLDAIPRDETPAKVIPISR